VRTIQISTDVYAAIGSHRLAGEEDEDAILQRLLATDKNAAETGKDPRMLWRDDVKEALKRLGGKAPLAEIYKVVRQIRRVAGRRIPVSLDAIVRRELEYNSSDSDSYTGDRDWFKSVDGIGRGVWAIR